MKTPLKVTKRTSTIKYAIRDVIGFAKKLEKKGKQITYLNIGDPVKFDFDTPEHVKQALFEAVKAGENWYGPSEGLLELREAICKKEKRVNNIDILPENVIVTTGVSEGIFMVMAAIIEKGDEILVPGPTYPPYTSYAKFFEGKPVSYKTVEEEGWQPDIEDMQLKISEKTKGIVIINPNNPCGAVYDENTVKKIVDLAAENDLLVLSDEIYDRIVYEEQFISTASIAKDFPVVGLNGFSKAYLATGWRLGYFYFHDPEGRLEMLKESVKKESRIRLCTNTPVQKAGVAALNGSQEHITKMVEKLRKRRDYAWKRLNEIEGISCTKPKGAFYVFPRIHDVGHRWKTDLEFVLDVLEKTGVLFVHGSGFCNTYGIGHVRGVFLPPIGVLENAFDRLEKFMKS
ncbi:MAG: aminotransferase class I/II-fold pyridoxal phosphate-dependent enzyme [Candidatus Bathyarchaeota archaeon]|nr:aminotransferase class I/II-fold pyridoxal phosphate-dependent enzyme [Candidatus Bathyarchaeota archaeon]MDH5494465.1 aminotransferase class I/II-fold pyridoxal phosphate-dependent enzyme [Candidatus Bathyarchaeota archaeon]